MKKYAILAVILAVFLSASLMGCNKAQQERAQQLSQQIEAATQNNEGPELQGNATQKENAQEPEETPQQQEETSKDPKDFPEGDFTLTNTFADIESLLPQMHYLIGENAPSSDVITVTDIKTLYISRDIDSRDAKLTSDVSDYKGDYIIIGSPCDNDAAARLFKEEIEEKGNCKIFPDGEGELLMKSVTNNDMIIYIGGNSPAETAKAAEVFMYPTQYNLSGTRAKVTGTKEDPVVSVVE